MLMVNNKTININKFPNNEGYIDLKLSKEQDNGIDIFFKYEDDSEFLYLQLLKTYIDNYIQTPFVDLVMPYIPYSRMDRKENERLFSLKTVAQIINGLNFRKVVVLEPHSDVSLALIDRTYSINSTFLLTMNTIHQLLHKKIDYPNNDDILREAQSEGIYLVFPDSGAAKRYSKQFKGYKNIIVCRKNRDFNTGKISNLYIDFSDDTSLVKKAIIVDDLCSKGSTFMLAAKALKEKFNVDDIHLVVTHCENTFLKNYILNSKLIKSITATDSMFDITKFKEYIGFSKPLWELKIKPLPWGKENFFNKNDN